MKILDRAPQLVLGLALIYTGTAHLTTSRQTFQAQVPNLLKDWEDQIVLISGVFEILLGIGLVAFWKYRAQFGLLTALFFIAIFWGNISQYLNHTDAFGLNSDRARLIRLFFQPLLVLWALSSTGAWKDLRDRKRIFFSFIKS